MTRSKRAAQAAIASATPSAYSVASDFSVASPALAATSAQRSLTIGSLASHDPELRNLPSRAEVYLRNEERIRELLKRVLPDPVPLLDASECGRENHVMEDLELLTSTDHFCCWSYNCRQCGRKILTDSRRIQDFDDAVGNSLRQWLRIRGELADLDDKVATPAAVASPSSSFQPITNSNSPTRLRPLLSVLFPGVASPVNLDVSKRLAVKFWYSDGTSRQYFLHTESDGAFVLADFYAVIDPALCHPLGTIEVYSREYMAWLGCHAFTRFYPRQDQVFLLKQGCFDPPDLSDYLDACPGDWESDEMRVSRVARSKAKGKARAIN
ncbi:hypothetical protein BDN72DRAFT_903907 [Pluteus cervinus]|uniref:Uncharacterized protein n=1 Tax=Pluteus cervinus TaxID=181527 RepID=A0ACD3A7V2_9AGAR|nr:hypothetical protein BDN72DRAFT_903907 [Pluteus cervinus]